MAIVAPRLALPVEDVLGGLRAKSCLATRFSPRGGDALKPPNGSVGNSPNAEHLPFPMGGL